MSNIKQKDHVKDTNSGS